MMAMVGFAAATFLFALAMMAAYLHVRWLEYADNQTCLARREYDLLCAEVARVRAEEATRG
jgi:hypothetical protein